MAAYEQEPSDLDAPGESAAPELAEPSQSATDDANRPVLPRLAEEFADLRDTVSRLAASVEALCGLESQLETTAGFAERLEEVRAIVEGIGPLVTERLTDYDETLQRTARQQAAAVDDNRANIEKALLDLRRSLVDSDDLARSVLSRLDALGAALDRIPASTAATTTEALGHIRRDLIGAIEAGTTAHDLELDADPIIRPIAEVHEAVLALRAEIAATLRGGPALADLKTAVDLSGLRDELVAAVETVRGDVRNLRSRIAPQQVTAQDIVGLVAELTSIREELTQLKRRIALRATPNTIGDAQMSQLAERIASTPRPAMSDDEVRRIAAVVADLLSASFEVVDDA